MRERGREARNHAWEPLWELDQPLPTIKDDLLKCSNLCFNYNLISSLKISFILRGDLIMVIK